ncbi:MAG: cellulase family glycosylhydrolase [Bacilli bacterium]|nr:cellulase family glycosylhydrolase [Bacilli bacterium]
MEKVIGVNLGNWLVLERWMKPKLFEGTGAIDETWLCRNLSKEEYHDKVKAHRDTYVTEEDFAFLASIGVSYIRIPVPYFIFGDRDPFPGCIEYLDQAFEWAKKHNQHILIDLHTAPHGQNGYDNGGITGVCKWAQHPEEVEFVLSVLQRLAARYKDHPSLYGIEVLNEPISWLVFITAKSTRQAVDKQEAKGSKHVSMKFLKQFYHDAYYRLREVLPKDKVIVFHDGFRLTKWNQFFRKEKFENVLLDTHIYIFAMEFFNPISRPWIYRLFLKASMVQVKKAQKDIPVIVGEWCISTRYCYKAKGKDEQATKAIQKKRYQEVAAMEMEAFSQADGWFYWNYQLLHDREEACDTIWKEPWDFYRCVSHGYITVEDIEKAKK